MASGIKIELVQVLSIGIKLKEVMDKRRVGEKLWNEQRDVMLWVSEC